MVKIIIEERFTLDYKRHTSNSGVPLFTATFADVDISVFNPERTITHNLPSGHDMEILMDSFVLFLSNHTTHSTIIANSFPDTYFLPSKTVWKVAGEVRVHVYSSSGIFSGNKTYEATVKLFNNTFKHTSRLSKTTTHSNFKNNSSNRIFEWDDTDTFYSSNTVRRLTSMSRTAQYGGYANNQDYTGTTWQPFTVTALYEYEVQKFPIIYPLFRSINTYSAEFCDLYDFLEDKSLKSSEASVNLYTNTLTLAISTTQKYIYSKSAISFNDQDFDIVIHSYHHGNAARSCFMLSNYKTAHIKQYIDDGSDDPLQDLGNGVGDDVLMLDLGSYFGQHDHLEPRYRFRRNGQVTSNNYFDHDFDDWNVIFTLQIRNKLCTLKIKVRTQEEEIVVTRFNNEGFEFNSKPYYFCMLDTHRHNSGLTAEVKVLPVHKYHTPRYTSIDWTDDTISDTMARRDTGLVTYGINEQSTVYNSSDNNMSFICSKHTFNPTLSDYDFVIQNQYSTGFVQCMFIQSDNKYIFKDADGQNVTEYQTPSDSINFGSNCFSLELAGQPAGFNIRNIVVNNNANNNSNTNHGLIENGNYDAIWSTGDKSSDVDIVGKKVSKIYNGLVSYVYSTQKLKPLLYDYDINIKCIECRGHKVDVIFCENKTIPVTSSPQYNPSIGQYGESAFSVQLRTGGTAGFNYKSHNENIGAGGVPYDLGGSYVEDGADVKVQIRHGTVRVLINDIVQTNIDDITYKLDLNKEYYISVQDVQINPGSFEVEIDYDVMPKQPFYVTSKHISYTNNNYISSQRLKPGAQLCLKIRNRRCFLYLNNDTEHNFNNLEFTFDPDSEFYICMHAKSGSKYRASLYQNEYSKQSITSNIMQSNTRAIRWSSKYSSDDICITNQQVSKYLNDLVSYVYSDDFIEPHVTNCDVYLKFNGPDQRFRFALSTTRNSINTVLGNYTDNFGEVSMVLNIQTENNVTMFEYTYDGVSESIQTDKHIVHSDIVCISIRNGLFYLYINDIEQQNINTKNSAFPFMNAKYYLSCATDTDIIEHAFAIDAYMSHNEDPGNNTIHDYHKVSHSSASTGYDFRALIGNSAPLYPLIDIKNAYSLVYNVDINMINNMYYPSPKSFYSISKENSISQYLLDLGMHTPLSSHLTATELRYLNTHNIQLNNLLNTTDVVPFDEWAISHLFPLSYTELKAYAINISTLPNSVFEQTHISSLIPTDVDHIYIQQLKNSLFSSVYTYEDILNHMTSHHSEYGASLQSKYIKDVELTNDEVKQLYIYPDDTVGVTENNINWDNENSLNITAFDNDTFESDVVTYSPPTSLDIQWDIQQSTNDIHINGNTLSCSKNEQSQKVSYMISSTKLNLRDHSYKLSLSQNTENFDNADLAIILTTNISALLDATTSAPSVKHKDFGLYALEVNMKSYSADVSQPVMIKNNFFGSMTNHIIGYNNHTGSLNHSRSKVKGTMTLHLNQFRCSMQINGTNQDNFNNADVVLDNHKNYYIVVMDKNTLATTFNVTVGLEQYVAPIYDVYAISHPYNIQQFDYDIFFDMIVNNIKHPEHHHEYIKIHNGKIDDEERYIYIDLIRNYIEFNVNGNIRTQDTGVTMYGNIYDRRCKIQVRNGTCRVFLITSGGTQSDAYKNTSLNVQNVTIPVETTDIYIEVGRVGFDDTTSIVYGDGIGVGIYGSPKFECKSLIRTYSKNDEIIPICASLRDMYKLSTYDSDTLQSIFSPNHLWFDIHHVYDDDWFNFNYLDNLFALGALSIDSVMDRFPLSKIHTSFKAIYPGKTINYFIAWVLSMFYNSNHDIQTIITLSPEKVEDYKIQLNFDPPRSSGLTPLQLVKDYWFPLRKRADSRELQRYIIEFVKQKHTDNPNNSQYHPSQLLNMRSAFTATMSHDIVTDTVITTAPPTPFGFDVALILEEYSNYKNQNFATIDKLRGHGYSQYELEESFPFDMFKTEILTSVMSEQKTLDHAYWSGAMKSAEHTLQGIDRRQNNSTVSNYTVTVADLKNHAGVTLLDCLKVFSPGWPYPGFANQIENSQFGSLFNNPVGQVVWGVSRNYFPIIDMGIRYMHRLTAPPLNQGLAQYRKAMVVGTDLGISSPVYRHIFLSPYFYELQINTGWTPSHITAKMKTTDYISWYEKNYFRRDLQMSETSFDKKYFIAPSPLGLVLQIRPSTNVLTAILSRGSSLYDTSLDTPTIMTILRIKYNYPLITYNDVINSPNTIPTTGISLHTIIDTSSILIDTVN